jgi:hypothetical protein
MDKIEYQDWPNCYRLANSQVDLIVTADVGPRIIRFGFLNQDNEMKEYPATLGQTGGDEWRNYGGHRLWHAPEHQTRTYYPDNEPVEVQPLDDAYGLRVIQNIEPTTGIQKEIDIHLDPNHAHVTVVHRFHSHNLWDVELAMWALTVVAPGGKAIVPLPPRGAHGEYLLPTTTLAIWPYTDMSDPRWTWGFKHILLQQGEAGPQKVGLYNSDGWLAYARNNHLFVKTFTPNADAIHPDLGCNVEIFTNKDMLELETLGPLTKLGSGQTITHTEQWHLFDDIASPSNDADVDSSILPLIHSVKNSES